MDQDQVFNILRFALTFGGTYLVGRGLTTDAQWTTVSGGLLSLISFGWGIFAHTTKQRVLTVAANPAVASVKMKDSAAGIFHSKVL